MYVDIKLKKIRSRKRQKKGIHPPVSFRLNISTILNEGEKQKLSNLFAKKDPFLVAAVNKLQKKLGVQATSQSVSL